LRNINVTPHVAQNTSRRSAIDRRTTRHPGYAAGQRLRKRIEEGFGWIKTTGGLRKTRHRGTARVGWMFTLTAAACNLVRLPKLLRRRHDRPAGCQLIGRWRIIEADLWDRDYLDLVAPAMLLIRADGRGEITFGAMQAGLDLEYSRSMVIFTWAGFDEMDEVSGSGSAELLHDGSLAIAFAYHLGDEAVLKAERATSSAPC
jgi:hypothetical protein